LGIEKYEKIMKSSFDSCFVSIFIVEIPFDLRKEKEESMISKRKKNPQTHNECRDE